MNQNIKYNRNICAILKYILSLLCVIFIQHLYIVSFKYFEPTSVVTFFIQQQPTTADPHTVAVEPNAG